MESLASVCSTFVWYLMIFLVYSKICSDTFMITIYLFKISVFRLRKKKNSVFSFTHSYIIRFLVDNIQPISYWVVLLSPQDIYRIKLPGPAILGEGKPENQNHAIIFTRGEGLQTIDMNQVFDY